MTLPLMELQETNRVTTSQRVPPRCAADRQQVAAALYGPGVSSLSNHISDCGSDQQSHQRTSAASQTLTLHNARRIHSFYYLRRVHVFLFAFAFSHLLS